MKIALLQTNPTVGDLQGNAALLFQAAAEAGRNGAHLAIASELGLLGYPPRDLLLSRSFVVRSRAVCDDLARRLLGYPPLLVGLAEANPSTEGRPLYNAAALLTGGQVRGVFRKTLLPTYDVFDEDRYFEPADGPQILELGGVRFGVSVCEDVWNDRDFWHRRRYHTDPLEGLTAAGAECILNLSASPFTMGKQGHRERMLGAIARKYAVPVLYVNQVGGADELVFDGRSCAFAADGRLIARAAAFAQDVLLVDLEELLGNARACQVPGAAAHMHVPAAEGDASAAECDGPAAARMHTLAAAQTSAAVAAPCGIAAGQSAAAVADDLSPASEVWRALVLGVRDYVAKSGFQSSCSACRVASTRRSWRPSPLRRWGPRTCSLCSCHRRTPAPAV